MRAWNADVNRDMLIQLVREVEAKDRVTAAHTWRVALYTQAMAEALECDTSTIHRLMRGAVLHDIGKVDIPAAILTKPDRLTDEEFEIIKQHPVLGYERLRALGEQDPLILGLVRSHHERLDGTGYPDGLHDDEIPLAARIFAVIDTFDALTSVRQYRRDLGPEAAARAIDELRRHAGEWYCHGAVEQFESLYDEHRLDWIMQHFNNEASLQELGVPDDIEIVDGVRERFLHGRSQS